MTQEQIYTFEEIVNSKRIFYLDFGSKIIIFFYYLMISEMNPFGKILLFFRVTIFTFYIYICTITIIYRKLTTMMIIFSEILKSSSRFKTYYEHFYFSKTSQQIFIFLILEKKNYQPKLLCVFQYLHINLNVLRNFMTLYWATV